MFLVRNKTALCIFSAVFLAVEIVLGVLLQISSGREAVAYSYTAVVLACLFVVLFLERSRSYLFTQIALFFTVCADYFLVWSEAEKKLPAMLFFSMVQIAYFLRICYEDENQKRKKAHLLLRGSVSGFALLLTWGVLGDGADALAFVSMFYYANLLMNLVFSAIQFRTQWILAIGFFLFLLCDTVIGLSALNDYLPMVEDSWLYTLLHPDFNLAWVFYLPSQTCLALSLLPKRLSKKKNPS